jgi:hypothetical protein
LSDQLVAVNAAVAGPAHHVIKQVPLGRALPRAHVAEVRGPERGEEAVRFRLKTINGELVELPTRKDELRRGAGG